MTVAKFISGSGINPLRTTPKIGEVRGFALINPPSSAMLGINDNICPFQKLHVSVQNFVVTSDRN